METLFFGIDFALLKEYFESCGRSHLRDDLCSLLSPFAANNNFVALLEETGLFDIRDIPSEIVSHPNFLHTYLFETGGESIFVTEKVIRTVSFDVLSERSLLKVVLQILASLLSLWEERNISYTNLRKSDILIKVLPCPLRIRIGGGVIKTIYYPLLKVSGNPNLRASEEDLLAVVRSTSASRNCEAVVRRLLKEIVNPHLVTPLSDLLPLTLRGMVAYLLVKLKEPTPVFSDARDHKDFTFFRSINQQKDFTFSSVSFEQVFQRAFLHLATLGREAKKRPLRISELYCLEYWIDSQDKRVLQNIETESLIVSFRNTESEALSMHLYMTRQRLFLAFVKKVLGFLVSKTDQPKETLNVQDELPDEVWKYIGSFLVGREASSFTNTKKQLVGGIFSKEMSKNTHEDIMRKDIEAFLPATSPELLEDFRGHSVLLSGRNLLVAHAIIREDLLSLTSMAADGYNIGGRTHLSLAARTGNFRLFRYVMEKTFWNKEWSRPIGIPEIFNTRNKELIEWWCIQENYAIITKDAVKRYINGDSRLFTPPVDRKLLVKLIEEGKINPASLVRVKSVTKDEELVDFLCSTYNIPIDQPPKEDRLLYRHLSRRRALLDSIEQFSSISQKVPWDNKVLEYIHIPVEKLIVSYLNTGSKLSWRIFIRGFRECSLSFLKEMYVLLDQQNIKEEEADVLLLEALQTQHLETIMWLHSELPFTEEDIVSIVRDCNDEIIDWAMKLFPKSQTVFYQGAIESCNKRLILRLETPTFPIVYKIENLTASINKDRSLNFFMWFVESRKPKMVMQDDIPSVPLTISPILIVSEETSEEFLKRACSTNALYAVQWAKNNGVDITEVVLASCTSRECLGLVRRSLVTVYFGNVLRNCLDNDNILAASHLLELFKNRKFTKYELENMLDLAELCLDYGFYQQVVDLRKKS